MENTNENLEMFMKELAELTDKYGLSIGGCGCCGSPWIRDTKGTVVADDLYYDRHEKKYK